MSRRRKNPKMGDILIYTGLAGAAFLIYRELMKRREMEEDAMMLEDMAIDEAMPMVPEATPAPRRVVRRGIGTLRGRGISRSDMDPTAVSVAKPDWSYRLEEIEPVYLREDLILPTVNLTGGLDIFGQPQTKGTWVASLGA